METQRKAHWAEVRSVIWLTPSALHKTAWVVPQEMITGSYFESTISQNYPRINKGVRMKVIKTEGLDSSLGSFMVINDNGDDFCDKEGNNAWDTYEEAERVMKEESK